VRIKCITNAVKYPQVASYCGCEIQSDSLSDGVAVEDSDDDDDNGSRVRDNFAFNP
jgi:hypothetical protein